MFSHLLSGHSILVSGATQGVGRAIALAAARQGADRITITGRNSERGGTVVSELEELGARAVFIETDLENVDSARASVSRAIEEFGTLDHVVNAAGITTRGSVLNTDQDLFDRHMAINVRAPFFIMQEAIKHLKERGASGSIVSIITTSSKGGTPILAPYAISKAALAAATKNAAHAHRWDRIRINGINIGWTDTPGEDAIQRRFHDADDTWREQAYASQPMGKLGQPNEIADFVVFLLSERSGVVTGSIIDWDQTVWGSEDA